MAGPAGGEGDSEGSCMCVCVGWGGGGGGGVILHLKFHNICSIGSTIYTTEAGVFIGSHCNWGLVRAFYVHVSEHVCRLHMHRCFSKEETRSG